jgi:hypothetical protein
MGSIRVEPRLGASKTAIFGLNLLTVDGVRIKGEGSLGTQITSKTAEFIRLSLYKMLLLEKERSMSDDEYVWVGIADTSYQNDTHTSRTICIY